jgi:hypothetical protein
LSSSHPPLRSRSARRKLAVTLGLAALAAAVPFAGPGTAPGNGARAMSLFPGTISSASDPLPAQLLEAAPGLSPAVLDLALRAARNARARGVEIRSDLLTVIDYTLPSTQPRLWVFDLAQSRLLFRDLVAHGSSTGELFSRVFSNRPGSRATSLGLFLTADTYTGRNGYSLRLLGLEAGINDRALERAIVMHGADYVSEEFARARGRLGRSWGCPAVSRKLARPIIDAIKGGSLVFSYYGDPQWLSASEFLRQ